MEKAYAKFNQNYERIVAGSGREGMRVLSAMPTKNYKMDSFKTADDLWNFMVKVANKDYPQTCGTRTSDYNIVRGHAYTVLRTHALVDAAGKQVARLV